MDFGFVIKLGGILCDLWWMELLASESEVSISFNHFMMSISLAFLQKSS
jgi:hypothetical protein